MHLSIIDNLYFEMEPKTRPMPLSYPQADLAKDNWKGTWLAWMAAIPTFDLALGAGGLS